MLRLIGILFVCAALLAGCAKPPQSSPRLAAYAGTTDAIFTASINPDGAILQPISQPLPPAISRPLAGRTLKVSNNGQLVLRPGEVILTFDDGPRPGRTEAVLEILDAYDVKATFLMLGEAAQLHPGLVRDVARAGHTIGTHTFGHTNLADLSEAEAMAEILAGQRAVAAALRTIGAQPSRFFRFPYLAQTGLIRASALQHDFIVLDVDVDSKDYYKDAPEIVMARTLERLEARGQGVILFHDIHARTVSMLPQFLEALSMRGYNVVALRSSGGGVFDTPLVTADAPATVAPL